jgi:uncharacterized protein YndB with AHSA1/START domain
MPSVSVSRTIAAPPSEVWEIIADVENARRWNPPWSRIEITSPQRHGLGMTFRAHVENGDAFDFRVTEWDKDERIAFAPIRGPDEQYGVNLDSHVFTLRKADEEFTDVTLTATASTSGLKGFFIGLVLWPGYQRQGLNDALAALAGIFEPEVQGEEEAGPAPAD